MQGGTQCPRNLVAFDCAMQQLSYSCAILLFAPGRAAADGTPAWPADHTPAAPSLGSAFVGSAPTGEGPSAIAYDPATDTIYVGTGWNADGPNRGASVVTVIDGRRCDAPVWQGLPRALAHGGRRRAAVGTRGRRDPPHHLCRQLG